MFETAFRILFLCLMSAIVIPGQAEQSILPPIDTSGRPVDLVLVGRNDVPLDVYYPLARSVQDALLSSESKLSAWAILATDTTEVADALMKLASEHNSTDVFILGHSMSEGAVAVQDFVAANPDLARGVILLSGFLSRHHRPGVTQCLAKADIQPKVSIKCPLGCLEDGVHDCFGGNVPDFPTPVLTVGGALDGVVRVARVAESWYTQSSLPGSNQDKYPVVVVEGMNHAVLLNTTSLPDDVAKRDLRSELSQSEALKTVSSAVQAFILDQMGDDSAKPAMDALVKSTASYLQPLVSAFVDLEGSWFFTGMDDEHGHSQWAADAQRLMAGLPDAYSWTTANEFHMLSDEDNIPPYYRAKHRPQVYVAGATLNTSTVTQLRYLEESVVQTGVGLNGWAIIKEEKLNVLTLPDTGADYVSAIDMSTKLASRQLVYNRTGLPSPESLDDGNRCADINQKAYEWALANVPASALQRFKDYGLPMKMAPDAQSKPSAGPFWIWKYMGYETTDDALYVTSYKAFYSLDANPYGAGNHYCKLLSPARAMEWILTDGLRAKYHV